MITQEQAKQALEVLREFIGAERCHLTPGGPSVADPEGNVSWYIAFAVGSNAVQSCAHIGFSHNGGIVQIGGTLNGNKYLAPVNLWKSA